MASAIAPRPPKGFPTQMKITVTSGKPEAVHADALALALHADGELSPAVRSIDASLNRIISDLRKSKEFKGARGEEMVVPVTAGLTAKRLILVGLGSRSGFALSGLTAAVGAAVRAASRRGFDSVAFALPELKSSDLEAAGELAAEGAVMATFDPASYRSKRETRPDSVKTVTL